MYNIGCCPFNPVKASARRRVAKEGAQPRTKQPDVQPAREEKRTPVYIKDEMNFAEFGGRLFGTKPPGRKQVVYSKEQVDFERKKGVGKSVTLVASDDCSLLQPSDAKVLAAFFGLTAQKGYKQEVEFRPIEVLRLLNLSRQGHSYKKVREACERFRGNRLKFKNTWYLNGQKERVSRDFSIWDYSEWHDTESGSLDRVCRFKWSDAVFQSIRERYVKNLQVSFLQSLGGRSLLDLSLARQRVLLPRQNRTRR